MKLLIALSYTAVAAAFVLPDVQIFRQLPVNHKDHGEPSWWDSIRASSKGRVVSAVEDTIDYFSSGLDGLIDSVDQALEDTLEGFIKNEDDLDDTDRPRRGHNGHDHTNLTAYQFISTNNYTTKFAKLVDEHDSIVKLLNSTKANYTVFVPGDWAFRHIPDDKKKPSKEFLESVLKYYIGLGSYPVPRILKTHTLPTALDEKFLGGEPQRLRTSFGLLSGLRVNFYSSVIRPNIKVKNGVIHGINSLLIPPPMVGRELTLLPNAFSTLLLAYDKTNFVDYVHGLKMNGSTVFAPTNKAFARLGPRANAFLFNTETGLRYLKALLKYQIVANTTLYTDAIYGDAAGQIDAHDADRQHLDLPTLLDDKKVTVDIFQWHGFSKIVVNGQIRVAVQDFIAKNGVIQIVDNIPIPPHKHRRPAEGDDEDIDVEELKERLDGFEEVGEL